MIIGKPLTALSGGGLKPLVRVSAPEGSTVTLDSVTGTEVKHLNPASHNLPSGFQEVEYIQSNGTQWIDTAVSNINAQTFGFETKFAFTESVSGQSFSIAYTTWSTLNIGFNCGLGQYNGYRLITNNYAGYGSSDGQNVGYSVGDTATIKLNGNTITYNGIDYTYTRSMTGNTSVTQPIFCTHTSSGYAEHCKAKCWYYKLSDGDTIIRNMIPCYCTEQKTGYKGTTVVTVASGTKGLYDLVNGRFYVNCGSGSDFTSGPIIPQYINSTYDFEATIGTHTVTAISQDQSQTKTQIVAVNEIALYEVTITYKTYLYNEGSEYSSMTGGWALTDFNNGSSSDISTSKKTDNLYVSVPSNSKSYWCKKGIATTNKVDITNYSVIKIQATSAHTESGKGTKIIFATSKSDTSSEPSISGQVGNGLDFSTNETTTFTYDLSNVTTKQVYVILIGIQGYGSGTSSVNAYKIWLE